MRAACHAKNDDIQEEHDKVMRRRGWSRVLEMDTISLGSSHKFCDIMNDSFKMKL